MTISENSQLGLRFISEKGTKIKLLTLMEKIHNYRKERLETEIGKLDKIIESESETEANNYIIPNDLQSDDSADVDFGTIDRMFALSKEKWNIKYFLIQQTVWKAAELIKIGENFTGRTLKDIKLGDYMYLIGKDRMIKFLVVEDGIKGIYWDDKAGIFFEWGVRMDTGKYFYHQGFNKEFSEIMQLLTFIELGDIEVKLIASLQHNGAKTKTDKIYNGTRNTVFVVDSTWNQILLRTEGFAVRGHFRLQPCGPSNADRKLIWVNAFEKEGYTRKPKAEIIK